jgi:hypothetical protein
MLAALSHWKLIGLGFLALLLAVQTVRLDHRSNQLERAKINLNECRDGRKADRASYIDAQRRAAELNKQDVTRIVNEQDRISSNVEADLTARLERLRSELRAKAAQGSAGRPQASPDGKAPGSASPEAGMCLAPDELLRAAENEERHDQLISWINEQLGVRR